MKYGVGVGREQHSAAEPSPFWSSALYVINILLLKAKVKHRVLCSPARDYPFELKVTFCVRGVVSPLLANIYLHYVFDLWVNQWRRKWAHGDMIVVRYADDAVLGFEHRKEAEAFLEQLRERMQTFGLELYFRAKGVTVSMRRWPIAWSTCSPKTRWHTRTMWSVPSP